MNVTVQDILSARGVLRRYLAPTPLYRHPLLSARLGFDAYVKHENHLPMGAFKVRGGMNLFANMGERDLKQGVIAATRGNHGLSLAYAARQFGSRCLIYVPRNNNPEKNLLIQTLGAEIVEFGRDFDDARMEAEARAKTEGLRFIHPANEPLLVAGVGTMALEVAETLPELDVIIVPMGSGSLASGTVVALRALLPHVKIVGVQAARAPALAQSLASGKLTSTESSDTFAGGLATRFAYELPFALLQGQLDEVVLVSEEEMRDAVREALETTHNVAEGAAAAAYAAARKIRTSLSGKRVVLVHTGQNTDRNTLRWALGMFDA
jgi:threonine dehydratase